MPLEPKVPKFDRGRGKDGKLRLYLIASNDLDISCMLLLAGVMSTGITRQKDKHFDGYYKILTKHDEKKMSVIFDIGGDRIG